MVADVVSQICATKVVHDQVELALILKRPLQVD